MFDKLEDKIEFEYKYLCSLYALDSIESCMSRAYEIAAKFAIYKKIQRELEKDGIPELMKEKMLHKQNLIDYLYLKDGSNNAILICNGEINDTTWKRILRYTDL